MGFFRRRPPEVADVYKGLRSQALAMTPEALGLDGASAPPVLVALMENSGPEGVVVSLVAVADGTASLYFSNGGGRIGAGTYPAVAERARAFVEACGTHFDEVQPAAEAPLPGSGEVRFHLVTREGLRGAGAPEEELGRGGHPLSPLFFAAHELITAMRLQAEGQE